MTIDLNTLGHEWQKEYIVYYWELTCKNCNLLIFVGKGDIESMKIEWPNLKNYYREILSCSEQCIENII